MCVYVYIYMHISVLPWVFTSAGRRLGNLAAGKGQFHLSNEWLLVCLLERLYILFLEMSWN